MGCEPGHAHQQDISVTMRKDIPLSGRLEEEPLDERIPLLLIGDGQPLLRVVFVSEIEKDGIGLPHGEVAVLVVDQSRDAAVRIVLCELLGLLHVGREVIVDVAVIKAELLENDGDLPGDRR